MLMPYDTMILLGRELMTVFLLIIIPLYIFRRIYRSAFGTRGTTGPIVSYTLMDGAKAPERASLGAAGYDLRACNAQDIEPGKCGLVRTGVCMSIPDTMYGRVAPRSSLASKHRIFVNAGVIDADYRGEIHVLLHNAGESTFSCAAGDRIAQLIFELKGDPHLEQVSELEATRRGKGGFGSTGRR